jgi:toxin-antitoxin system PIN domain toxin
MLLCDTNVWLALTLSKHVHHHVARAWLDTIDEPSVIHFCRATQQSFLRLMTTHTVLDAYGNKPLSNAEAWSLYAALLADDRITMTDQEPIGLEEQWKKFAIRQSASPKVWMDAYLAAFAFTAGLTLVTTDADFLQYQGIDLRLLSHSRPD